MPLPDDPVVRALVVRARHVLRSTCGGSHWLGLEVSDLVAEGWLAYQVALGGADPSRGDPSRYARACAWHAMRRLALTWHGGLRGVRLVQIGARSWERIQWPDADIDHIESRDALDVLPLLEKLSSRARAVLTSIYVDRCSVADTATRLGMPIDRVYAIRYRSVERLKVLAGGSSRYIERQRTRERAWVAKHGRSAGADARYNHSEKGRARNARKRHRDVAA